MADTELLGKLGTLPPTTKVTITDAANNTTITTIGDLASGIRGSITVLLPREESFSYDPNETNRSLPLAAENMPVIPTDNKNHIGLVKRDATTNKLYVFDPIVELQKKIGDMDKDAFDELKRITEYNSRIFKIYYNSTSLQVYLDRSISLPNTAETWAIRTPLEDATNGAEDYLSGYTITEPDGTTRVDNRIPVSTQKVLQHDGSKNVPVDVRVSGTGKLLKTLEAGKMYLVGFFSGDNTLISTLQFIAEDVAALPTPNADMIVKDLVVHSKYLQNGNDLYIPQNIEPSKIPLNVFIRSANNQMIDVTSPNTGVSQTSVYVNGDVNNDITALKTDTSVLKTDDLTTTLTEVQSITISHTFKVTDGTKIIEPNPLTKTLNVYVVPSPYKTLKEVTMCVAYDTNPTKVQGGQYEYDPKFYVYGLYDGGYVIDITNIVTLDSKLHSLIKTSGAIPPISSAELSTVTVPITSDAGAKRKTFTFRVALISISNKKSISIRSNDLNPKDNDDNSVVPITYFRDTGSGSNIYRHTLGDDQADRPTDNSINYGATDVIPTHYRVMDITRGFIYTDWTPIASNNATWLPITDTSKDPYEGRPVLIEFAKMTIEDSVERYQPTKLRMAILNNGNLT